MTLAFILITSQVEGIMVDINQAWVSVFVAKVAKTWYFAFAGQHVNFAYINEHIPFCHNNHVRESVFLLCL